MASKRRLSAVLFTDMVGYTDLMSKDEKLANKLRKRQTEIVKKYHDEYQGEIVQFFGDGTLSIFESAVNTVKCAIAMQLEFQEEPIVPVRVGIHTGEVVWEDDGLYGHAVNKWLTISTDLGNYNYPFLSKHDSMLENLRGDPRFQELMSHIKAKSETFRL